MDMVLRLPLPQVRKHTFLARHRILVMDTTSPALPMAFRTRFMASSRPIQQRQQQHQVLQSKDIITRSSRPILPQMYRSLDYQQKASKDVLLLAQVKRVHYIHRQSQTPQSTVGVSMSKTRTIIPLSWKVILVHHVLSKSLSKKKTVSYSEVELNMDKLTCPIPFQ